MHNHRDIYAENRFQQVAFQPNLNLGLNACQCIMLHDECCTYEEWLCTWDDGASQCIEGQQD